jgi:phosphomevalonate kinase
VDRALSAPGKLFLSGEYAVLWGGVARVLAVGPRVQALVRRRPDRQVELLLEGGKLTGQTTPLGVQWEATPGPDFHFVARTVDLGLRALSRETSGFSIAFAPSPLWQGRKLGLGSSARATVLAAEAVRWAAEAAFDALKLALVAHAEAQGGKGSGGDVAASFAGGLVRYRRYELATLLEASTKGALQSALFAAPPVELARLDAPRFPMVYAFSGQSASTTSLVKQVEREWSPAQRGVFVERSDALSDALEVGLARKDFTAVTESCAALQALLFSLGPTRTESLERILSIAAAWGCAGKQSGAGGGDGCLLFAPDLPTRAALLEALAARGIFALEVDSEEGLRGDVTAEGVLTGWL